MGICTVLIALGSMILAGICGANARAQSLDRTPIGETSLFGKSSEMRDRSIRLESSFRNIVDGDNRSTSIRLMESSLNSDMPLQLGRAERFSFTTGGLPKNIGPVTWKRVYGMVGAYALHRGNYWGAVPGLSLATGGKNAMLQATSYAPSARLKGRSFLSLAIRF